MGDWLPSPTNSASIDRSFRVLTCFMQRPIYRLLTRTNLLFFSLACTAELFRSLPFVPFLLRAAYISQVVFTFQENHATSTCTHNTWWYITPTWFVYLLLLLLIHRTINTMAASTKAKPSYDIVVFGATSFVGSLVVEYFLTNYGASPPAFKWALAAR